MKPTNGSTFTDSINIVDNAQGGTAVSNNAVVTIESGCAWTLTGDCTITLADGTVLRRPRFQHIKTVSNVSFETVFYGYPQLSRYVSSAGLLSPTYQ